MLAISLFEKGSNSSLISTHLMFDVAKILEPDLWSQALDTANRKGAVELMGTIQDGKTLTADLSANPENLMRKWRQCQKLETELGRVDLAWNVFNTS